MYCIGGILEKSKQPSTDLVHRACKPVEDVRVQFFKICFFLLLFLLTDFTVYYFLKKGIIRYYGLYKDAQILCVGHSQMVLGIDAERLSKELGMPTVKYAVAGANVTDRMWMVQHALTLNPTVKLVIYDVDTRLFDSEGLSSASYSLFLPFIDDVVMSKYLYNHATWQEYYIAKLIKTTRFRDQTLDLALRGMLNFCENKKTGTVRIEQYQGYLAREWQRKIRVDPSNVERFSETLDLLCARDIKVILTYLPVMDLLNNPDRESHALLVRMIEKMVKGREQVYFLNYNIIYEARHDLFFDPRHLNEKGKQVITSRLINDVRGILNGGDDNR
jgi:hypothetical protein